jgi:hypothetical protein
MWLRAKAMDNKKGKKSERKQKGQVSGVACFT